MSPYDPVAKKGLKSELMDLALLMGLWAEKVIQTLVIRLFSIIDILCVF